VLHSDCVGYEVSTRDTMWLVELHLFRLSWKGVDVSFDKSEMIAKA
jgi:hypothetical protein